MLFHSLQFVLFLPLSVIAYFLITPRLRWILLLGASYYFYACWRIEYLILIIFSTLVDYLCAILIERSKKEFQRNLLLLISVIINLSLLAYFKYGMFFAENLQAVFTAFNIFYNIPHYQILLPVGISFYTFQTLSYTVDVYWKKRPAEKHFGIFALYVSFFPQLVAGPIERSTHLLPQFHRVNKFDWQQVHFGTLLILWGLFKKLVVGDRLLIFTDTVFKNPEAHNGLQLLIVPYAFWYQLYCDFSAYTDIAIGSALMFGYKICKNFDRPFASRTIREFWQRWHISLSKWIGDYVFVPLAKGKPKGWQRHKVTLLAWVLIGFWHGANWTFVAFGLLHACYIIFSDITRDYREKIRAFFEKSFILISPLKPKNSIALFEKFHIIFQIFCVINLIAIGAVFFCASSLNQALLIFQKILAVDFSGQSFYSLIAFKKLQPFEWSLALIGVIIIEIGQWLHARQAFSKRLSISPIWIRWPVYYSLILAILMFGRFGNTDYYYFQF